MQDNFFQQSYHSYDKVYTNQKYNNHIFIGDIQSATDTLFHASSNILTGMSSIDQLQPQQETLNIQQYNNQQSISYFHYSMAKDKIYQPASINSIKLFKVIQSEGQYSFIAPLEYQGSTLVISYIMKKQRLTFKEAIKIVRKSRPSVLPNIGFERQLKKYEHYVLDFRQCESARRSQVKTSESGKVQNSFRLKILPSLSPFKNIPFIRVDVASRHSNSLNVIKDSKIFEKPQSSKQKRGLRNNRRIYIRKGSKQIFSINKGTTKTEPFDQQQQPYFHVSKLPISQPISSNRSIYELSQIFKQKREENMRRKLKVAQKASQFNFLLKANQSSK